MGSRKRRKERDDDRKIRRRSKSNSRSPSTGRSRSPVDVPPPPSISTRDRHDRDRRERSRERSNRSRERDREERHRRHKEKETTRRRHEKSPNTSKRSRNRRSLSKHRIDSDSSDCVEVPLPPPAPIISKKNKSPSPNADNGAGDVLSIAETNKLRAKLGMKPLELDSKDTSSSSKPKKDAEGNQMHKDEWGEFYHKPAANLAEKLQAEKLREKFRQHKEKRTLDEKLKRHKTLGESDDEDDVSHWVDKSREKEKMKEAANRREKALAEMDEEFVANDLVREEARKKKKKLYSSDHLKGLRVEHDVGAFVEGKSVILTLKDQDVLDEETGDALVNVNMLDDERYRKNIDNKKLNPNSYGYNVYSEEVDEFGDIIQKDVLSKYDEEIGGSQRKQFTLGKSVDEEIAQKKKLLEIKAKLSGKRLERLDEPLIRLASDTYTESELETFKKPKKKKVKKLRQKLKAEDLEPLPGDADTLNDHGKRVPSRHLSNVLDTDDYITSTQTDIKIEEEDNELEHILSKARRLKQTESIKTLSLDMNRIKAEINNELDSNDESKGFGEDFITLNETAEFCRTLGDIPTYGMAGNRGVEASEIMDFEQEPDEEIEAMEEEESTGKWNSVTDNPVLNEKNLPLAIVSQQATEVAILDEEPDVASGMGAALKLALSKGYLEKEDNARPSSTRMAYLQAKNYSIEDKTHGEDEKFNRRDRYHSGPTNEFKEKDNYKPNVKLEYIDDNGRLLNEKEAFRYLSHKFHGKGPSKNKIEKRLKKNEQDGLMMKMSSTDTPLGTLTMLQHKQKETHSPYIVLSGSKQMQGSTSITKHK